MQNKRFVGGIVYESCYTVDSLFYTSILNSTIQPFSMKIGEKLKSQALNFLKI